MININEMTLGQIRELQTLVGCNNQNSTAPYEIGKNYFIRTVTHHYTGKLIEVYPAELVLMDAAWIADSGRFADSMKSEDFNEVEPYPDGKKVIIGRGSILDASVISKIPRSQK